MATLEHLRTNGVLLPLDTAAEAAMRRDRKPASRYRPFIDRVQAYRDAPALDDPKTTTGVAPHDVL